MQYLVSVVEGGAEVYLWAGASNREYLGVGAQQDWVDCSCWYW